MPESFLPSVELATRFQIFQQSNHCPISKSTIPWARTAKVWRAEWASHVHTDLTATALCSLASPNLRFHQSFNRPRASERPTHALYKPFLATSFAVNIMSASYPLNRLRALAVICARHSAASRCRHHASSSILSTASKRS